MLSINAIYNLLPNPPDDYHYFVEQSSPQIRKVWLIHEREYSYTKDEVRTIYCFVKGDKVYEPISSIKMKKASCCSVQQLFTRPSYRVIMPEYKVLTG